MKTSRVSSLPLRKTRTISTRSNDAIERDAGSDDQMAAGRRNVGSRRPHFGIRRQLRTPLVNSIDQFVSGARIVFCKVGPDLGDVTLKAWKIGSDLHSARLRRFASSRRPASFIRRTVAWSKGRGSPLAPPSSHIWRSCSRVCPKSARRSCHFGRGLVYEHQAVGLKAHPCLTPADPLLPRLEDLRASSFRGHQQFLICEARLVQSRP